MNVYGIYKYILCVKILKHYIFNILKYVIQLVYKILSILFQTIICKM